MVDAPTTASSVRADTGAPERKSFLRRRLHSLLGVLPLGAFLCDHLFQVRFGAVG